MSRKIIYLALNLRNGKGYVGQTSRGFSARYREHLREDGRCGGRLLAKALRKYGNDAFLWSILQECDNLEELNAAERAWIAALGTMSWGYNIYDGGDVHTVPPSTRKKLRAARLGTHSSATTRAKQSASLRGRPKSQHMRDRLSAARKGRPNHPISPEIREQIAKALRGRLFSAEHRHKISEAVRQWHQRRRANAVH